MQLKAQKKEDQDQPTEPKTARSQQKKTDASNIGRLNAFNNRTPSPFDVSSEAKTLRTSTSVKRVELAKRQQERQERRHYVKGVASLRNTREIRRLTQEELLEEAKITGTINLVTGLFTSSLVRFRGDQSGIAR